MTESPSVSDIAKILRDEAESYEETVHALLAFAAFVIHDGTAHRPDSDFGFGRRMTLVVEPEPSASPAAGTAPELPSGPSAVASHSQTALPGVDHATEPGPAPTTITPDLVAQHASDYGVVCEIKRSLNRNEAVWEKHRQQLRKYDNELIGWWTQNELIAVSDACLLIHISRGRAFVRELLRATEADPNARGTNTTIIEFNKDQERAPFYFFRQADGNLRALELAAKLLDGIAIPMAKVLKSFPNVMFYDARPPVIYLIVQLWSHVLPAFGLTEEIQEVLIEREVEISVASATSELQRAFGSGALSGGPRSAEFPRTSHVREALERLVSYGLAFRKNPVTGEYVISFKPFHADVYDVFARHELKLMKGGKKSGGQDEDQLRLFSPSEDE